MKYDEVAPDGTTDYNQDAAEFSMELVLGEEMQMSDPRSDEKFLYDELLMMLDDGM